MLPFKIGIPIIIGMVLICKGLLEQYILGCYFIKVFPLYSL
jgi:hypothetical protein